MELNEALDVVQQVKNRYRAFEKLEEVIQVALGAQSSIKGSKATMEKISKDIASRHEALRELDTVISDKTTAHAQKIDAAEGAHKKRLVEMEEEASERGRALNAHLEELSGKIELQIAELQMDKRHLQDEVTGLQQAKDELETALQELKARFSK